MSWASLRLRLLLCHRRGAERGARSEPLAALGEPHKSKEEEGDLDTMPRDFDDVDQREMTSRLWTEAGAVYTAAVA